MVELSLVKMPSDEYPKILYMIRYIGIGNGLVPSGNQPLPEVMLTQIYVPIGYNELTFWCFSVADGQPIFVSSTTNLTYWGLWAADEATLLRLIYQHSDI